MTRKATSRAILAHFTTPRLSIAQRFAAGKALREQFPREAHSWLPPAPYDRDPIAVLNIQTIIRQLRAQGIGVLISDHNVRETLGVCDTAYILDQGMILEHGSPERIAASPKAREIYLGEQFTL